jgi:hypothetical protein
VRLWHHDLPHDLPDSLLPSWCFFLRLAHRLLAAHVVTDAPSPLFGVVNRADVHTPWPCASSPPPSPKPSTPLVVCPQSSLCPPPQPTPPAALQRTQRSRPPRSRPRPPRPCPLWPGRLRRGTRGAMMPRGTCPLRVPRGLPVPPPRWVRTRPQHPQGPHKGPHPPAVGRTVHRRVRPRTRRPCLGCLGWRVSG